MNDRPGSAVTQNRLVLSLLRERGERGVSARELVFDHGITRAAARVYDLKESGYAIETIRGRRLDDGTQEMARYVLREPAGDAQIEMFG